MLSQLLMYYDRLLQKSIEALKAFFIDKKFSLFDPHVGETSCHIRAYKNLILASEEYAIAEINSIRRKITLIRSKIHQELDTVKKQKKWINNSDETLANFFERKKFLFSLPEDFFYLIQSYILSLFCKRGKDIEFSLEIDVNKLRYALHCGRNSAEKLINHFQKNLSQNTCDFVIGLLSDLPQGEKQAEIFSYMRVKDNHKREMLPYYDAAKVTIEHFLKNNYPVFVIVYRYHNKQWIDKVLFLFTASAEKDCFLVSQGVWSHYLKQPAFIVEGIVTYTNTMQETPAEFQERFFKVGFSTILLANLAKHPQYASKALKPIASTPYTLLLNSRKIGLETSLHYRPSETLADCGQEIVEMAREKEKELLKMQQLAENIGCCLENPTLFLLKHISCNTLDYFWKT